MGLFDGGGRKELFYPNCRPVPGSSEGRVVLECQPKMQMADGKVLAGERPAQIVIEQGRAAIITDDGGNPEVILERLLAHIENKRLSE